MKRNSAILFAFLILGFSCCTTDEEPSSEAREAEVYFTIKISPSLNGRDLIIFNSQTTELVDEVGSDFKTEGFSYFSNTDLEYEIQLLSEKKCYTATVESFFENKAFDIKVFSLGGFPDTPLCPDGSLKKIIIKTPK